MSSPSRSLAAAFLQTFFALLALSYLPTSDTQAQNAINGHGYGVPVPAFNSWPTHFVDQPHSLRLEYLGWWIDGNPVPPLATTSPAGTPIGNAGVLGVPGTEVLLGGDVDDDLRSGLRITLDVGLGDWFCHLVNHDIQFQLITLGQRQNGRNFGSPILARPFFDLNTGAQASLPVAHPDLPSPSTLFPTLDLTDAQMDISTDNEFGAAGFLWRSPWGSSNSASFNRLIGFRYLRYEEGLAISEQQVFTDPGDPTSVATVNSSELFDTRSSFYGADLGLEAILCCGRFTLESLAKVAVGNVSRKLAIDGATEVVLPGASAISLPGRLLSAPSNIGRRSDNEFGFVPELGFTIRTPLYRSFAITAGYTVIAFPKVLRTGDQIDTTINFNQPIGPARPRVALNDSTLWIHGFHVGCEF